MIKFIPWRKFIAFHDKDAVQAFIDNTAEGSEKKLRDGMMSGPHTGRIYRRRGGNHQASAPGQYPAKDTGALVASIKTAVTSTGMDLGTNKFYSIFLRNGTRRMARRKMSDSALQETVPKTRAKMKTFARWRRG